MTEGRPDLKVKRLPRFRADEGQTMVEYGIVLVTVALAALAAYQAFGSRVSDLVNTITW